MSTVGSSSITFSSSPSVVGVSPNSGSGSTQTFSFQYADGNGSGFIHEVEQIFNTVPNYTKDCVTLYIPSSNAIYLVNDDGSGWFGPVTPGTTQAVHNGQCTVSGGQSSVSSSGNVLTLNLAVSFSSSFAGPKNIYSWVQDNAGADSGLQTVGTWAVTNAIAINHVFFMLQENHSFDNYFGRMGQYRTNRGFTDSFDGVPLNVSLKDANGKTVQPS